MPNMTVSLPRIIHDTNLNDAGGSSSRDCKILSIFRNKNSDHGIIFAIITQRLSSDNFPSKGRSKLDGGFGVGSTFRYITKVILC